MLTNSAICVFKLHKETAMLETLQQQSELKDSEQKSIMAQEIVSMELIRVQGKETIPAFDREVLSEKLHQSSTNNLCKGELQEFVIYGMSKGSILFFHVKDLSQLFCRFTVHREAVTFIRYIAESETFLSFSSELDLVFWKLEKNEVKITC